MDREMRSAIRAIQASGQSTALIRNLLAEGSWQQVIEIEKFVDELRKSYRRKRVRAITKLSDSELRDFKLLIVNNIGDGVEVPITMVRRKTGRIMFDTVDDKPRSGGLSLVAPDGYNLGIQPLHYASGVLTYGLDTNV